MAASGQTISRNTCYFDRDESIEITLILQDDKIIIADVKGVYDAKKDGLEVGPPAMLAKQVEFVKSKLSFAAVTDFDKDKKQTIRKLTNLSTTTFPQVIDLKELKPGEKLQVIFDNNIPICENIIANPEDKSIEIQQPPIYRVSPTEYRLSLTHALSPPNHPYPLTDEKKLIYSPKTDLHTHFSGVPTADMLIRALAKKHEAKEAVNYPVQFLKKFDVDLSIYFPDSKTYAEFERKYDAALKLYREDKNKGSLNFEEYCLNKSIPPFLFDISNFIKPTHCRDLEKNKNNLELLRKYLHIPKDQSIIFDEMEIFYKYRDIFIKDMSLSRFLLREIAVEYQKQGIKYAEISFSKVIDPAFLKIIHEEIDTLEKDTGCKIRFLGIISRVATEETRRMQIEQFKEIAAKSPYVIGIDLLAAEINSTYDLFPQLIDLANWASTHYPGMIIRIHAGEYSFHPENIEGVVKLAESFPNLVFRVGHGVYGADPHVIQRMKRCKNLIIEINMASNVALNSIVDIGGHSVFDYIKEDVPVVLGSDGNGLYDSQAAELPKLLSYSVSPIDIPEYLAQLAQVETNYIKYANYLYVERNILFQDDFIQSLKKIKPKTSGENALAIILKDLKLDESQVKQQKPEICKKAFELGYFSEAFAIMTQDSADKFKRIQADIDKRKLHDQAILITKRSDLELFCKTNSITLILDSKLSTGEETTFAKTPVMLTGILEKESLQKDLSAAKKFIESLLASLDPEKVYFVTTGTADIGINPLAHELIHAYNVEAKKASTTSFTLACYVPSAIRPDQLSDKLDEVYVIHDVATWHGMYQYFDKKAREDNLILIVMGGHAWQRDLILVMHNVLTDPYKPTSSHDLASSKMYLMSDISGASQQKSRELPKHYQCQCSWDTATFGRFQRTNLIRLGMEFKTEVKEISIGSSISLHGRHFSSTKPEIAGKFLQSLKLKLETYPLSPEETKLLTDLDNIKAFIDCAEMNPSEIKSNPLFGVIYGITMKTKKTDLAYDVAVMTMNWKIKIPELLLDLLSKEQKAIVSSELKRTDNLINLGIRNKSKKQPSDDQTTDVDRRKKHESS